MEVSFPDITLRDTCSMFLYAKLFRNHHSQTPLCRSIGAVKQRKVGRHNPICRKNLGPMRRNDAAGCLKDGVPPKFYRVPVGTFIDFYELKAP